MKNQFKPFRAIRYTDQGSRSQVLAPPYDVISPEEQKRLYESHPNNIVRIDFGMTHSTDSDTDNRYTRSQRELAQWISTGILAQDDAPAYYMYEHTYHADGYEKKLRGILGAGKLYRFEEGVILPHENTMPGPISDRLELTKSCTANLSPIYTLFDDPNQVFFELTASVWAQVSTTDWTTDTGDRYRLWKVTDTTLIHSIYQLFEEKKLLIADGHHRYTTALHYRDWCRQNNVANDPLSDYTLMFATPLQNDGLTIYPTHRVVFDIPNFDSTQFRVQLTQYFELTEVTSVAAFHQTAAGRHSKSIGVVIPGESSVWLLNLKSGVDISGFFPSEASNVLRSLDVSILQFIILQGILGYTLDDIRGQKGIRYLKSDQAVIDEVAAASVQAAFVLQATRLDEMRDVCMNGEKMPQKSTYFYPKLITGMVINPVDSQQNAYLS